jgi:exonuclease SbcC
MILKSIRLENVRSYRSETIEFPGGTTLFEGDIGSGKSTILMAIEFALFGLGSEKGAALLRKGENRGTVVLTFDVDGQEYTVTRRLVERARGSVQQDKEGVLDTPQGTLHLSATELKERILQILGFNEPPDPKAQSLIYRYAVFTPQEEMKGIIFSQPDARLQTLRKALHIEDYKVAATNAGLVQSAIKRRSSQLEAAASDVEEIQESIRQSEEEAKQEARSLRAAVEEETKESAALTLLRAQLAKYQNQQVQLSGIRERIKPLDRQLIEKKALKEEYGRDLQKREKRVKDIAPIVEAFRQKTAPSIQTVDEVEADITRLEIEDTELQRTDAQVEAKISDYRIIEKEGVCPTCDRPADAREFESKISAKLAEKLEAGRRITSCAEALLTARRMLRSLQEYEKRRDICQQYESELERLRADVASYAQRIRLVETEIGELEQTLASLRKESEKLGGVLDTIADLNQRIQASDTTFRRASARVVELRTDISALNRSIKEGREREKLKLEQRRKAKTFAEYEVWLGDFFIPTLNLIEKHILANANQEFNQHFQRWFSLLVEDVGKTAMIDETFTPIIEQDGYEQDVHYLSGGEKTSVALAYRLALNILVQRASTSMKSNLLILDEPTDGFSKEQLSRVKDILEELECPQVIIVSHERELESFADQIFSITKTQGDSAVVRRG